MPQKRMLNQNLLQHKSRFIFQLREEYHKKGTPLWDCFMMYIGFIKFCGAEYLVEMTFWQIADYNTVIENYKTIWHRTRRGGKSIGLSVLGVFFSLIEFGYRANAGCVVWRAPYSDQLDQAKKWMKMNPFVMWISGDGDVEVLDSEYIDMSCLGSGKVASRGISVFIMDEYKKVKKDSVMYGDAKEAYGMMAEGPNTHKRMISASTGARLTEFHSQFLSDEWKYCRHDWKECPWITEEFVESERRGNPEDPWYVPQEYECVWVARGGTAFRNVYIVDMKAKTIVHNEDVFDFGDHPFFPLNWTFPTARKGGVDWNDSAGHYVVVGSEDDEAVYLNQEYICTTVAEIVPFCKDYSIEVESGPFPINIANTKKLRDTGAHFLSKLWSDNKEGKGIVSKRFRVMMDKMVIIDRHKASFTLGNFQEAIFDPASTISKLKKNTKQHGLDAAMHMIHKKGGKITHQRIATNLDPNYVEGQGYGKVY